MASTTQRSSKRAGPPEGVKADSRRSSRNKAQPIEESLDASSNQSSSAPDVILKSRAANTSSRLKEKASAANKLKDKPSAAASAANKLKDSAAIRPKEKTGVALTSSRLDKASATRATLARLRGIYPDAHCELDHSSPFTLLVATVLSAQTTDVLVNKVTPHLFARYPDAPTLAAADPGEVARQLAERGMGMYNQKAKNIVGLARLLVERHGGEVPRTLAELVALPGVGRKTANVVLGVAFGAPEGVVVDTHVQRLSQRLGWSKNTAPGPIELDLCALFPRKDWDILSHTLIFHGRRVCFARKPACSACGISADCPSAFHAENVGRKAPRKRTV